MNANFAVHVIFMAYVDGTKNNSERLQSVYQLFDCTRRADFMHEKNQSE
jgi:hypothetical protein